MRPRCSAKLPKTCGSTSPMVRSMSILMRAAGVCAGQTKAMRKSQFRNIRIGYYHTACPATNAKLGLGDARFVLEAEIFNAYRKELAGSFPCQGFDLESSNLGR